MKRKIKNYVKIGFLFLGMSLILLSCEQEQTLELRNEQRKSLFIPKAMNLTKAKNVVSFNKLSSKFKLTPFLNSQKQTRSTGDFNLDLENFYEIQYDDYISYTFLITRETSTDEVVENLVVEQKNNSIRGYIIKYEEIDYYPEANNIFLRAKVSRTSYQGDINELINDNSIQFRTSSEWDCELVTTTTLRVCSVHGSFQSGNPACGNYGESDWDYNTEEICTYTGSGTGPDTIIDQGDSTTGGGETTDGATTPIIPCRESLDDLGLVGSNSNCEEEKITIDPSVPDCVKNIIAKMREDTTYIDLGDMPDIVKEELNLTGQIMDVFNNSERYNLNFKVEDLGLDDQGNELNARTTIRVESGKIFFDISLNTNYVNSATDLSIARSLIHEALHAYISYLYQDQLFSDLKDSLDHLINQTGSTLVAQHMLMTQQFMGAIANSLESWDDSSLSNKDYYDYLSWSGGMIATPAFSDMPSDFQQNSLNANIAEQSNTSNALGTRNCD